MNYADIRSFLGKCLQAKSHKCGAMATHVSERHLSSGKVILIELSFLGGTQGANDTAVGWRSADEWEQIRNHAQTAVDSHGGKEWKTFCGICSYG